MMKNYIWALLVPVLSTFLSSSPAFTQLRLEGQELRNPRIRTSQLAGGPSRGLVEFNRVLFHSTRRRMDAYRNGRLGSGLTGPHTLNLNPSNPDGYTFNPLSYYAFERNGSNRTNNYSAFIRRSGDPLGAFLEDRTAMVVGLMRMRYYGELAQRLHNRASQLAGQDDYNPAEVTRLRSMSRQFSEESYQIGEVINRFGTSYTRDQIQDMMREIERIVGDLPANQRAAIERLFTESGSMVTVAQVQQARTQFGAGFTENQLQQIAQLINRSPGRFSNEQILQIENILRHIEDRHMEVLRRQGVRREHLERVMAARRAHRRRLYATWNRMIVGAEVAGALITTSYFWTGAGFAVGLTLSLSSAGMHMLHTEERHIDESLSDAIAAVGQGVRQLATGSSLRNNLNLENQFDPGPGPFDGPRKADIRHHIKLEHGIKSSPAYDVLGRLNNTRNTNSGIIIW